MPEHPTQNPFARSVVLELPGVEAVQVTPDRPWNDADRVFDLYRPFDAAEPLPAVIFVTGFPDPGFRAFAGCALKDTAPYRSWARLLAASGLAAVGVGPRNQQRHVGPDCLEVVEHPTGPHAFDVLDDSDTSRDVIRRVVAFLGGHLLVRSELRAGTKHASGPQMRP